MLPFILDVSVTAIVPEDATPLGDVTFIVPVTPVYDP